MGVEEVDAEELLVELSTFPLSRQGLRLLDLLNLDQLVVLRQTFSAAGRMSVPVCNNLVAYLTGRGWPKLVTAWNIWGTLKHWIHPSKSRRFRTALWVWYAAPYLHGAADIEGTGMM